MPTLGYLLGDVVVCDVDCVGVLLGSTHFKNICMYNYTCCIMGACHRLILVSG